MKLIKITNKGSIHFRLTDGRLGVCYESGYVRVNTKYSNMYHGKKTMYKTIIKYFKNQYPYSNDLCRDKYNEFIQDILHDEIINKL